MADPLSFIQHSGKDFSMPGRFGLSVSDEAIR